MLSHVQYKTQITAGEVIRINKKKTGHCIEV